jgi:hypothetical protein
VKDTNTLQACLDENYNGIVPEVCPICCTIKSIMTKEDRLECSVCGSALFFDKQKQNIKEMD